jgi:hypothetical protein
MREWCGIEIQTNKYERGMTMFITQKIFKSLINEAYKGPGLTVGRKDEHILLAGSYWSIEVTRQALPNKALAAIIELTGELPQDGENFKASKEGLQYQIEDAYWNFTNEATVTAIGEHRKYIITDILLQHHPYGNAIRVLQSQDEKREIKVISNMFINAVDHTELNEECESYVEGPFTVKSMPHLAYWRSEACMLSAGLLSKDTRKEGQILLLELLEKFDFSKRY